MREHLLLGNEAIGRGLVEAGVTLAASYPGTPASEILPAVVRFARELGVPLHAEWSINEKVAFETALANAMTGRRAAVAMKQVGLNVAADPFLRSAYLGVIGGFLVIAADDPGPHSSQTEQDSRFFAMMAKIPVLDPSSPREAKELVPQAFALSEKYELPVLLRPTTRVCHARQNVPVSPPVLLEQPARFQRNPARWSATPVFVRQWHRQLNDKIERIAREADFAPRLTPGDGSYPRTCLVASGAAFAHAWDVLEELGLSGKVDLYQVLLPYPLAAEFAPRLQERYERVLVLEETSPVIELQLPGVAVWGRQNRFVPREGELTPEVILGLVRDFLDLPEKTPVSLPVEGGARPTLCAGCGHRAAFYALRQTFPQGIFPSDIGCYTLGLNLQAVDTCHCMGAGISQAAGFYHAYKAGGGEIPPIVATIGDSTFYHAGVPALLNALFHKARFILVILDNGTTAMTGHQPTLASGITAQGELAQAIPLEELLRGCGVTYLKVLDPYEIPAFRHCLQEAWEYCQSPEGRVAVIIARHPCILNRKARSHQIAYEMEVTENCIACLHCLEDFECPGLRFDDQEGRVVIDRLRCSGCGVCIHVCPEGAIVRK